MSNELVVHESFDIDKIERLAGHLAISGYFQDDKKGTPEQKASQMVVKILAGQALGLDPVASVTGIDVINEKIRIESNIMATLINRSLRHEYKITEHTEDLCRIEFYRDDNLLGEGIFTITHAKQAGLMNKPNWKSYPFDMLYNRAMSRGFRKFCPELGVGSNYTEDELVDDDYKPKPENMVIENPFDQPPELLLDGDHARQKWIESIMASEDFPTDGSPVDKVAFINAGLEARELNVAPVTVPELLGNGG